MNKIYFEEALKEAELSLESNDVPIGAVIVSRETLISKGHNSKILLNDPTAHAEALAIRKACSERKDWRLSDCDLYVTLKPCEMCEKVINNSRINNVFYLLDKPEGKKEYAKTKVIHIQSDYEEKYKEKLKKFFNKLR